MNFNWQEFMNGGLAVHCGSKELAEDFLNECRQRDIKVGNNVKWVVTGVTVLCMAKYCSMI